MNPNMENIQKYIGHYKGQGTGHDGEGFHGELELQSLLGGKGFRLRYTATDDQGKILHQEESTLAQNEHEAFCLWNLNSNSTGLLCHMLTADEYTTEGNHLMHFEYGELQNPAQFRERIVLTLHARGPISYDYAWGLPDQAFAERSSIKLFKTNL